MKDTRVAGTLLLTVPEAAAELRISENSLYRLIARGLVQTVDVGTGRQSRTRVTRKALEDFIAKRVSDRPVRAAS